MADTKVFSLRIPMTDYIWLQDFVSKYPGDTLNALLSRFIRTRIEELMQVEGLDTPEFEPDISSADIFGVGYDPRRPRNHDQQ